MLSDSDYVLAMLAKEEVSRARAMARYGRLALTAERTLRETRRRAEPPLGQLFRTLTSVFRGGRSVRKTTPAATREGREMTPLRCVAASVVTLFVSVGGPIPQIIAGMQMGPVRLGMQANEGVRAALVFEHDTGCRIDLLVVAGKVAATGTPFGGCLEVSVPRQMPRIVSRVGFLPPPVSPFMDGPASSFIAAFGAHRELRLSPRRVALIWPQGLIAHVAGISVGGRIGDGAVTYLAVVAPGSNQVPAIGYFQSGGALDHITTSVPSSLLSTVPSGTRR
jgi:hypothetical protein